MNWIEFLKTLIITEVIFGFVALSYFIYSIFDGTLDIVPKVLLKTQIVLILAIILLATISPIILYIHNL